ncbi:hypothetical protein L5515_000550 [Caenorhabditis briggsae]|uniref:Uncharacterized protein n=1 Tax=Caenorhabditis briggsae TaxID=6238 RepID=A0AAE9E0U0_CAEBR|nr:hypothetical protein L5515_000550 [Caenorhabditis briggsae]
MPPNRKNSVNSCTIKKPKSGKQEALSQKSIATRSSSRLAKIALKDLKTVRNTIPKTRKFNNLQYKTNPKWCALLTQRAGKKSVQPTEYNPTDDNLGEDDVKDVVLNDNQGILLSDTDSDGISSSSAEDSEDDYEREIEKNPSRRQRLDTDSSDEEKNDETRIRLAQTNVDRKTKKERLLKKEKKYYQQASNTDEIVCDYESAGLPKQRRRRLYRRKTVKVAGNNKKRRRINRLHPEMAIEYSCDTFTSFGTSQREITTEIDWNDAEINSKALRKMFEEMKLDDDFTDESEDEADIISHSFAYYQSRNARERVSQMTELKNIPYSEKLASYNSYKSIHGSSRSMVKNYHPALFDKREKLPEALLWEKPFTHHIRASIRFDAHEKCNNYLNRVSEHKRQEKRNTLLDEIRQVVYEKSVAQQCANICKQEEGEVSDQATTGDHQYDNYIDDSNYFRGDEFLRGEDLGLAPNGF